MRRSKLFRLGDSHVTVMPAMFLRLLGWNTGDELDVRVSGREVIVTNATQAKPATTYKRKPAATGGKPKTW